MSNVISSEVVVVVSPCEDSDGTTAARLDVASPKSPTFTSPLLSESISLVGRKNKVKWILLFTYKDIAAFDCRQGLVYTKLNQK